MLWVEKYEPFVHQSFVLKWLNLRHLPKHFIDELPHVGFFVWKKDLGVAVGFLRSIERCNYCLIDSFMTNPEIEPFIRNEAMDLLTKTILERAKQLHFSQAIAMTEDDHTRIRALKFGFKERSSQKVLVFENNERTDEWVS